MKNLYLFGALILSMILFGPVNTNAQWNHTGPEGGEVRAFCASGTNIFVSPWSGGIYRSTDDGANWTPVNNGLTDVNIRVTALFADGTYIFAGIWGSGVFLSTDNGNNWTDVNNSATAGIAVHAFAKSGTNLFVASQGGGVARTTDNGANWELVNNGLLSLDVRDLAVMDTTIFAATWGTYKVFKSVDNGDNWTQCSTDIIPATLDDPCLEVSGNNLFLGTYTGGVFLSTDKGDSWTAINNGLPANSTIRDFAVSGTNIFTATRGSGVYITTDNGTNWSPASNGITTSRVEVMMSYGSQDLFAGAFGKGIFHSTDNGANWFAANSGFNAITVHAYAKIADGAGGQDMLAGTEVGVYLSADNGANWSYLGLGDKWITGIALVGTDIFVSTMGSGAFRSTDNGATWAQSGLENSMLQTIFANGTDLYAGAAFFGGAARSTDNGNTWTLIPDLDFKWVMSFAVNDNHIFAGAMYGGAFRSDDNGATFIAVNNGLDNRVSTIATMDTSTIFAGTGDPNGMAAAGIYKSVDNGNNWTQVNNNLPTNLMVWSLAVKDTNLFACSSTSDGSVANVYLTRDKGNNWSAVGTGLVSNYIQTLFVGDTKIFAGTIGSGTWWRPLSEMIPPEIPAGPTNLVAVADTFTVALSWSDNSDNELGFKIERKDDSLSVPGNWTLIDSVGANVTTFVDSGVTPNTTYSYMVYAYNTAGNSESDSVETTTFVPVELTSFTASVANNAINLSWNTATETNNKGFAVERLFESDNSSWKQIGFVEGFGTTTEPKSYSFTDSRVTAGKYLYRLKQIDLDGTYKYSNAVEVNVDAPLHYTLNQNYPNPFNPSTNIGFSLKSEAKVTLSIYNVLGQKVASLINNNEMNAGEHSIRFDASEMPTGIYFYTLEAKGTDGSNFTSSKKMMLLK